MLSAFALLLLALQAPSGEIATISEFANARNEGALTAMAQLDLAQTRPFRFLTVNGAYGSGAEKWSAKWLVPPKGNKKYVVFSTWIQCEDLGEQVFEFEKGRFVRKIPEQNRYGIKVEHQQITVEADPSKRQAKFKNKVIFHASGNDSEAMFRLGSNFHVTSLRNSMGQPIPFEQAGGVVWFDRSLAIKENAGNAQLNVEYFGDLSYKPEFGWIDTNEMMLSGSCWWPSIGRQASTTDVTIKMPKDWWGVTTGDLVEEKVADETRTMRYRNELAIAVLSLSAGKFERTSDVIDGRTYWVAANTITEKQRHTQNLLNAEVVKFFQSIYPWPFRQWGVVISKRFRDGALEAYSYATYQDRWLPDEEPHEPAHTFWGGVIPNNYMRSMWNESFADYFELYYRREGGPGNRADRRLAFVNQREGNAQDRAFPATVANCELGWPASVISYGRGGKVLSMLEDELGPDMIKACMKTWLQQHPRGELGEWEDFEKVVNKVTGQDYTWFFDQWLRRAGYAQIDMEFTQPVETPAGWNVGTLRFRGQPYRLRLEAMVDSGSGPVLQVLQIPARSSVPIILPPGPQPRMVSLDPYLRILRDIRPDERRNGLDARLRLRKIWAAPGYEGVAQKLLGVSPEMVMKEFPADCTSYILVGNPTTEPKLAEIYDLMKEAPEFGAGTIEFRGQTVKEEEGGFVAQVKLPNGRYCALISGKPSELQFLGQADAALVDSLGRLLAATVPAKEEGSLTMRY